MKLHCATRLVVPAVVVTNYRKHCYWCKKCKQVVSGRGKEELPNSYIGPQAKAIADFLKYTAKVSQRNMKEVFERFFGLKIVPSSVPGFHNQTRRKALCLYAQLKEKIKKAPVVHADETGSPMNGKNYWDWIFATTKICLHVVRETRGQKVVEEILGKKFSGILLADFYSAYNKLEAKAKQRCLVHLLRELKKALECSLPGDPIHIWCQRLKDLIQQAIDLAQQYQDKKISLQNFKNNREQVKQALGDFQFPDTTKGVLKRLSKRLAKYKNEIFTFLDYPGTPYHNNHAEQLLRSTVLLRKVTFGHKSANGAYNQEVLMSLQQTAKLNGKNPITMFKSILTSPKDPPLSLCMHSGP